MYSVEVNCVFHGKSFAPADDATCALCDAADDATCALCDAADAEIDAATDEVIRRGEDEELRRGG